MSLWVWMPREIQFWSIKPVNRLGCNYLNLRSWWVQIRLFEDNFISKWFSWQKCDETKPFNREVSMQCIRTLSYLTTLHFFKHQTVGLTSLQSMASLISLQSFLPVWGGRGDNVGGEDVENSLSCHFQPGGYSPVWIFVDISSIWCLE